ncbi:tetratricopeptide repeat protein [Dolichospermum sp. ST_con]|nr:tetratricopeptide repeat protein [Dolichospermum sp. ST_con]
MDWTTPLKTQQADFIQRLKSADLLHCDKEGQHSEFTVISGERLTQLRDFCWEMVGKFKPNNSKNHFIKNMTGKLGEEVVKTRLSEFITEIDYERRIGGDGKVDFTLINDPSVGIQVKARHGSFDKVRWSISREEIEKNAVLVCILIQEEVSEARTEYNLIFAGFLPTSMITSTVANPSVRINELLYSGGLRSYLDNLISDKIHEYMRLGNECLEKKDYEDAIDYYTQVLQLKPNHADAYYYRGYAYDDIEYYDGAIEDYTQVIKIDPNYAHAYWNRGVARSDLGYKRSAIKDFQTAASIYQKEGKEKDYQYAMQQVKKLM